MITNYHIINENIINKNKTINLTLNDDKVDKSIIIDGDRKIYTNKTEFNIKNSVVALGKFDGLHLGHKKLLEAVLNTSEKEGYTSVLFSFDTSIISESKQVNTFEERIHICENMNPDYYIYYPVSKETMEMRAKDFIENVLIKELGVKKVVTGKDFLFGRKREGNTEILKKYADEGFFEYEIIDDVYIGGLKVSTSMIKKSLSWEKFLSRLNNSFSSQVKRICTSLSQSLTARLVSTCSSSISLPTQE